MYLYWKYKGLIYEIPIDSYGCSIHSVRFNKKLDPRVDKLGWANVALTEGEIHYGKIWLSEKNMCKAKEIFSIDKNDKIDQLRRKIEKLEKSL